MTSRFLQAIFTLLGAIGLIGCNHDGAQADDGQARAASSWGSYISLCMAAEVVWQKVDHSSSEMASAALELGVAAAAAYNEIRDVDLDIMESDYQYWPPIVASFAEDNRVDLKQAHFIIFMQEQVGRAELYGVVEDPNYALSVGVLNENYPNIQGPPRSDR